MVGGGGGDKAKHQDRVITEHRMVISIGFILSYILSTLLSNNSNLIILDLNDRIDITLSSYNKQLYVYIIKLNVHVLYYILPSLWTVAFAPKGFATSKVIIVKEKLNCFMIDRI